MQFYQFFIKKKGCHKSTLGISIYFSNLDLKKKKNQSEFFQNVFHPMENFPKAVKHL